MSGRLDPPAGITAAIDTDQVDVVAGPGVLVVTAEQSQAIVERAGFVRDGEWAGIPTYRSPTLAERIERALR